MKNENKKVIHIVEAFGGGIFSVLVDLINGIDEEFEIIVAYGKRKQTPKNFKQYFSDKVKFVKIENFTREINLEKDIGALKEIKNIIKKEKPNIVHLHSSKAGILGRLAISGSKVKMFYNPHGFSFLKQDDSKIKRIIYWLIEKVTAIINKKCTIVGCSKEEFEEAKKLNKNSVWINNGIDIEKLEEETKELEQNITDYNNLKICTVGRIGYQKNPKLFNEIAKNFPNLSFTWIGDGELRDELTSKNIVITGWKNREDVLKILNGQDIFILTSLWEGLPISLLEAMFMKKICIVSDCIGNRDVIKNGKNGFIANDKKEFVEIIKSITKNKKQIDKIKEKTRACISNTYCNEIMVKQYIQEYLK